MKDDPLVSVIVYNYNYGKYLNDCLASVFGQTYKNIEVLFSDNASEDESWSVALAWWSKNKDRMFIARNHQNFGTDANLLNCSINVRGQYVLVVGSDDTIDPTYIESAVGLMEKHKGAGMLIVNRQKMNAASETEWEAPFFNQDCIIKPPGLSFVYVVAAINPSITQVFYRAEIKKMCGLAAGDSTFGAENYATRILDFNISLDYDVIYLKNAYVNHRIHGENQSLVATATLNEVLGPYYLSRLFLKLIKESKYRTDKRLKEYSERVNQSYSTLAYRYAVREFAKNNLLVSKKYLYLSAALNPEIASTNDWMQLSEEHTKSSALVENNGFASHLHSAASVQRTTSYDPPLPFVVLDSIG